MKTIRNNSRLNRVVQGTAALVILFIAGTALAQTPPVANAGSNVTANEGDFVVLDGSQSYDTNTPASPLSYQWTQIAGPTAALANQTGDPLYVTVPFIGGTGGVMTFQLTVTNGSNLAASATVNVQIAVKVLPPVPSVTVPPQVLEGSIVTLDGSASYDPNGYPLTYTWVQQVGPSVSLDLTNPAKPTFTAPIVGTTTSYRFQLTVSNGTLTNATSAIFQSVPAHHPPIANGSINQTVAYGTTVTLNGTGSTDPDGNTITYLWTQTAGPTVTLNDPTSPTPSFTAPSSTATLTFSLVVSDVYLSSAPATVSIAVYPADAIPNCAAARANKTQLWPPNETFARIKIRGLETDPQFQPTDHSRDDGEGNGDADDRNEDNDQMQVHVTSITQDELGILTPDAVVQSTRPNGKGRIRDLIMIRREEQKNGQGRIYTINFTVTNITSNLSCTGSVQVCVPPKRGENAACVPTGSSYDSFTQ